MLRRSRRLKTAMLISAFAAMGPLHHRGARAQEPTPAPCLNAPPPRYQPAYTLPVDPVELEHRGRRKKTAGAVLMGVGTALSVVGAGFALDGALHAQCSGHEEHAVCTPSLATSELQLGTMGLLLGQVMTVVGIPIYIVGGRQVAAARRLLGELAFQPLLGGGGAGGLARVNVRF